MLQQTQVNAVIPYYQRWLERFPDFRALALADEAEVLRVWQGLGYYARARNLHRTAQIVWHDFGGELPATREKIAQFPGIGRYTAGAITSFAFDLPEPAVDANIARVLARLTNWHEPVDTGIGREHLWKTARELLPRAHGRAHNLALMDLGALICLPRQPRCTDCPVRSCCRAENPGHLPLKKKKPATVRLIESHALVNSHRGILLEQSSQRWRGLWILPRLDAPAEEAPMVEIDFPFTHHRVTLKVFPTSSVSETKVARRWFLPEKLSEIPMPTPHRKALTQLLGLVAEA